MLVLHASVLAAGHVCLFLTVLLSLFLTVCQLGSSPITGTNTDMYVVIQTYKMSVLHILIVLYIRGSRVALF